MGVDNSETHWLKTEIRVVAGRREARSRPLAVQEFHLTAWPGPPVQCRVISHDSMHPKLIPGFNRNALKFSCKNAICSGLGLYRYKIRDLPLLRLCLLKHRSSKIF